MRNGVLAAVTAALILAGASWTLVSSAAGSGNTPAAGPVRIKAGHSRYGTVIFTGDGRAVYLFARDHGKSTCSGACARAWPPVLTKGKPVAAHGANAKLLGTVARSDGTRQVTYAGHPLYHFTDDKKPGEITCQNVSQFGAKWLVLTPAGRAVR